MARWSGYTITPHRGNGREINRLYHTWMLVKTAKQHQRWAEKVRGTTFGTYGNKTVLDILPDWQPVFPNTITKEAFYKELTKALNTETQV